MTRPQPEPEFVTIRGMARMLGVSARTAGRIARDARLPVFAWGTVRRVRIADVRALAAAPQPKPEAVPT